MGDKCGPVPEANGPQGGAENKQTSGMNPAELRKAGFSCLNEVAAHVLCKDTQWPLECSSRLGRKYILLIT